MLPDSQSHLAVVTPIHIRESRQIMNPRSLFANSVKLVFFQTLWIGFAILGAALINADQEWVAMFGLVCWTSAVGLMFLQFCLVFVYPEWPINLTLCRSVRHAIEQRNDRADWVTQLQSRVVELVPRDRWQKNAFETATDLLLLHVDETRVALEGDCDRYELPADSILGAELQSLRPPGWLTSTNMIVITARTARGVIELPIAYRDHRYGGLRNSRRRQAALELLNRINRMARGGEFQFSTPAAEVQEYQPVFTTNPYAAPQAT